MNRADLRHGVRRTLAAAATAVLLTGGLVLPGVAAPTVPTVVPPPVRAIGAVTQEPTLRAPAATTVDDRALARSAGGWATVGTLSRSLKAGATLTSRTRATSGGAVLLQFGPGRGVVEVRVGGTRRATVKTAAAKVTNRWISFPGTGTVQLRVIAQGKGVFVDAVRLNGGSSGGGSAPWSRGALRQLDVNSSGQGSNGGDSEQAALSPGGNMVAFWSNATNLYPGVTDGNYHVFVSEVTTGQVIFVADTTKDMVLSDDRVDDTARGIAWAPIRPGNEDSRELLFTSWATNLAPLREGQRGPVPFVKNFDDLSVTALPLSQVYSPAWAPDGHRIAFSTRASYGSDTNGEDDIWVYDRSVPAGGNDLTAVSVDAQGNFAPCCDLAYSDHPTWSKDSSRVLFTSRNHYLVPNDTNQASDIFIKNLTTGAVERVSTSSSGGQQNNESLRASWSPDNRYVAFDSKADNLTTDDTNVERDIFVKDLSSGRTTLVSRNQMGQSAMFASMVPKWSPDGTRIAFMSKAVDLTPLVDANQVNDVYVVDLRTGANQLVSVTASGKQGNSESTLWYMFGGNSVSWTPDSKALVFESSASNFSNADGNAYRRSVFIKTL